MDDKDRKDILFRTCESLFSTADKDKDTWYDVVEKVMPELIPAANLAEQYDKEHKTRICSHARVDILNLATAHMSHIFPEGQRWFRFEPWQKEDEYEVSDDESWFSIVTDITVRELARSNFQTEMNSVCVDRCVTGTGIMLVEMDPKDNVLVFTHIPAGTYAVAQDAQHNVNTVVRKFTYTPAQMAEAFGVDNLPEDIKRAYDDEESRYKGVHEVWHIVAPSRDFYPDADESLLELNPYISAYLEPTSRSVLEIGEIFEFPYMVTRFIRYGNCPYGLSPLTNIKDTINDLMVQEEVQRLIGQRAAVPSVIIPADLEGEVDLRSGGQTIIPPQYIGTDMPRSWAEPSNYQIGNDIIERLKAEIDAATHVDMMQVISKTDRYMTATEVSERSAERVLTFYPSFSQCQVDARSMWNRVFALCLRAGKYPMYDMPEWVVEEVPVEGGLSGLKVISPKVAYTGRMAQMMERTMSSNADAFLAKMLQLASASQNPVPLAIYDMIDYCLGEAYANGVPAKYLRKPNEVKQEMARLQRMQETQAAMQQQLQQAQANRDNAAAENYIRQYEQ